MLAISGRSVSSRRSSNSIARNTWSCHPSAATTTSLFLKGKQERQKLTSDVTIDEHQSEEGLLKAPASFRRGFYAVFRDMTFSDLDEDSGSDYVPSEEDYEEENEESEGDDTSTEELFERYHKELEEIEDSEEEKIELYDDLRWWKSSEDKRRWEKQYYQADVAFRKRFGCTIDTPAHPETRRRLRQEEKRYRVYKFVLIGLVIVYLMQLAFVYSASSWAFSMVTWKESSTRNNDLKGTIALAETNSNGHSDVSSKVTAEFSQKQIPDYVRTGLHLCATLSLRVVKSEHDAIVTQHALRACDIAVKFAPESSREAIKAHVLRGDLRSLISRFDSADEDYKAAMALLLEVERSGTNPQVALELHQDVKLKTVANHWTQLYKTKRFKELRREAKARALQEHQTGEDNHERALSELAVDWLSAFKQRKPVLEVLTRQRRYTLRLLKYEALDGDYTTVR